MKATLESRFFHYNGGIRIHYKVVGSGPAPIVFLHGFASAHDTWLDLAAMIPAEGFTLYLLDLKGFGLSSKPKDGAYSIEDQAVVVTDFMRSLGLISPVIIGHSMGGAVALRICLNSQHGEEPVAVRRVVLIDCAAYPQKLPRFFRRLRTPFIGPMLLRLIPVRRIVATTIEKVFCDPAALNPARLERYARYFRGRGIPYALWATVKAIDTADYSRTSEYYRSISLPALIIWGKEDRVIRLKNAYRLHDDIRGSQLKIFNNCGHSPQEERPRETCAAILAFLDSERLHPAPKHH